MRIPLTMTGPRPAWLLAAALTLAASPREASAQFGYGGMGFGGFFGGFNYVPSPTNFLNQHALQNAARAGAPRSNNVYANNPNSYINRVRDNGFTPHYDVRRRQPSSSRADMPASMGNRSPARRPAAPAAAPEAAAAPEPPPKPALPLESFYDGEDRLVWPADAPYDGALSDERARSDQAVLAVLRQSRDGKAVPISTVAEARQKLLDYGRPALQEIREKSTPRISDTFHFFLLSLYESLAQAAGAE